MAEKKGAGGNSQTYDPDTGRYGNSGQSHIQKTREAIRKYSDTPERDIAEYGGLERKPQRTAKLPKQEYAEVCSAVRTRYGDKIPTQGHLLYGDNYYRFKYNLDSERILCTFKLPIDGNEQLISEWSKLYE